MKSIIQKNLSYKLSLGVYLLCIAASFYLSALHQGDESLFTLSQLGVLTLLQFSLAAGLMTFVWYLFTRQNQVYLSSKAIRQILWVAIIARVILLPLPSYTSSDTARYLFDGQVVLSGFDPYSVTHEEPALQAQREIWQPPAEHAKYTTIYPPLALALFSTSASFGPYWGPLFWKLLVTIASLGTLWLGYLLLKHANKRQHLPLLALSPLLILEAGIGAHIDAFSTLAVCAALRAWQVNRANLCGFFIGLGIALKLSPMLLLGPLFFAFAPGTRKGQIRGFQQTEHPVLNGIRMATSALATVSGIYLFAVMSGYQAIGSLQVFFQKWRFGSPLFTTLENQLSSSYLILFTATFILIGLSLIAYLSWRQLQENQERFLIDNESHQHQGFVPQLQWVLALPLIISPVVFPWYLMPLIPLLALAPSFWLLAWTCLLPLTYEVLGLFASEHIWQPASWPLYAIAFGLAIGVFCTFLPTLRFLVNKYFRPRIPIVV